MSEHTEPAPGHDRAHLRADCERCFALCCVAPAFSATADFAIDKAAGRACPNLSPDFRCGIHSRLREQGFRGCAVYDCFGAGQQVAQVTFGGQDWRTAPKIARQMFDVFAIMRQLHELLWYLTEALTLPTARPLAAELGLAVDETERFTRGGPDSLISLDLATHRHAVNALLLRASQLARAGAGDQAAGRAGASPVRASPAKAQTGGTSQAGADHTGASLRGACLIGAGLSDADLTLADLTGADLRDAELSGANLAGSIFLSQSQLDSARGDSRTALPPALSRSAHWSVSGKLPPSKPV